MKKISFFQLVRALSFCAFAVGAHATDLTTNTLINALDNRFEGADLVISNCTVTMDGPHGFASLQILNGGVLTHSGTVNGILALPAQVTDEPQVLSSATPATLGHTNIFSAVQVTDLSHSHTYTDGVDYVTTAMPDGTTQLLWTNTSAIADGASVLVSYTWNYFGSAGLNLTVTNDVGIAVGGSINVSGHGYSYGFGSGAGFTSASSPTDGSGAGHGGSGGTSAGNASGGTCYGVIDTPTTLGSSGGASYAGAGGSGGGSVHIVAGGNIHLDGTILANGATATNSRAGGGAGGSIWLVTTNLTGSGTLAANGGAGEPVHGGGGGGGRISLQCGTNSFSGTLTAAGGSGWQAGGAGTLFTRVAGQPDFLLADNAGRAGASSTIALTAGADVLIRSNATVIATGTWNAGNLTMATNSTLVAVAQTPLMLNVSGALALQAGSRITADQAGYVAGTGSGAGHYYSNGGINPCSGGSHGGSGAPGWPTNATVGTTYGSQTEPITFGSGGGSISSSLGGSGGGAIRLAVSGSAQVDGIISANGGNGAGPGGGGGAGGSIYLTAASVSGSGIFQANGGSGAGDSNGGGGGGGGGRIAIISSTYNFTGTLLAAGGGGANWGGAGTIFYQLKSNPSEYQLILDNNGYLGAATLVQSASFGNLIVRNGAVGTISYSATFGSLMLASNAWLTTSASYNTFILNIISNAIIQSDSGITLDAVGSQYGPGNGGYFGGPPNYPCGGGSHGGLGGNSISNLAAGGSAYESLAANPSNPGGPGGSATPYSYGGAGGGVLRLTVSGGLQLDGVISANGGNGSGLGGGGGAGGSLNLTIGSLTGTGRISANGGNGVDSIGGGGGGGCIAINSQTNMLTGPITAYGGSGANYGGAGTIYFPANSSNNYRSTFVMDNGGHAGAGSIFPGQSANLTLQQGARIIPTYSVTVANLMIASNSWLIFSNNTPATTIGLTASGNVTVQAGGGISADAAGYAANMGTGAGKYYPVPPYYLGSGAGHGGTGGAGLTNALGGVTYDSSSFTTLSAGSGGGGSAPYSTGGKGGGVVQLTVSGTLQLDGRLSANGEDGSGNGGGGGSGGGLNLNVGTLAGTGIIAANGGNGANGLGGGGGGGRIALVFSTNTFTGALTALGGSGANYGGAGVIYWQTNGNNYGSALVDNAGHLGADSSLPTAGTYSLALQNGGKIYGSGTYSLINLLVGANSSFLVSTSATAAHFLTLTVAGDATVQPGGRINGDASGNWYGGGNSIWSGTSPYYACGGGGHAGYGASTAIGGVGGSAGLDSISAPSYSGGNGGSYSIFSIGGLGGGVIHLNVTGKLQVDGQLSANGGPGSGLGGGGGAGGTLTLYVGRLTGNGQILARGGNGASNGGGGGGGHISLILTNTDSFAGTMSAAGGGGAAYGGAGLIYYKTNNTIQSLVIADNAGQLGTNTPIATLTVNDNLTIRNGAVVTSRSPQNLANLLITSNAWLTIDPCPGVLALLVNQDASIQAGGGINLDVTGDSQNYGTGRGTYYFSKSPYQCSGAGHGGYGACAVSNAVAGGTSYDSAITPSAIGSGGGGYSTFSTGGSGGGLLNCRVNGILQLDGTISANGGNGSGSGGGGGSGGGLLLNLNTLAGTGSITANGGNGATTYGGGGGGGRIALYFGSQPTNTFAGTISAYGGGGANFGGAGTIYFKTNNQTYGMLLLDNADHAGTNTSFDPTSTDDLTIQKGAIGALNTAGGKTVHNLLIRTNGYLTTVGIVSTPFYVNSATIENGGALTMDGTGFGALLVGGASVVRAGGSHGGYGGGLSSPGSYVSDSIQNPVRPGFGGVTYANTPAYPGGAGGGALTLYAQNLTVNGRLSADGRDGSLDAGGGAGGALNLNITQSLDGSGRISASGGAGNGIGGGGGGGRIAINTPTNQFTGQLLAMGGGGLKPGGAGTIFTTIKGGRQTVRVDNGGLNGTNTPLASAFMPPTMPYDLIIAGGATLAALEPLPLLSNLTIANGSTLTMPGAPVSLALAVQQDLNLAGNLTVDGQGYASASGPGTGNRVANQGSGGGYGGHGGASASGAPGGITYGVAAQPVDFGSGGSLGQNTPTGGSEGGGALRVSVGGTLTVNGQLSANGNDGWQDDSGGGAGGSIWITAQTLAGTGAIAADGGAGDLVNGGGGGGGRIAIYAPTNIFTGTTSVSGGIGAENGETGTSFLATALADWQVLAQSPTGLVSNEVSWVDLTFNEVVDPASIAGTVFALTTPAGPLPTASLGVSVPKLNTVRVSFPAQTLLGGYTLQVSASLRNFFGQPLAAPYAGSFTLAVPVISGNVTDTNGAPVAGVTVQPNDSFSGATTDASGHYAFGVPLGWTGTVTPAFGTQMFIPGTIAYTNVTSSLTNQNYLLVPTVAPLLANSLSSTNLSLNWTGLAGVTYQAWWSTNLADWHPFNDPLPGTNGPMQISLPLNADPAVFYRLSTTH